jgi:hypothetical protein
MPWFKIDDHFWSHPKTGDLSDSATALWVRAGSWSAGHLTDGFVPTTKLRYFRARQRAIDELVDAGLWDEVGASPESDAREARGRRAGGAEHGYVFHDWADYQPSREAVTARRDATKKRVDAWRKGVRNAVTESSADESETQGVTPPPTRPDPTRPDPSSKEEEVSGPRKRGTRIPEPFIVTRPMREWASTEVPTVDVDATTRKFVDHWRATTGRTATKLDWVAAWRNWLRTDAERHTPQKPSKDERALSVIEMGRQLAAQEQREISA